MSGRNIWDILSISDVNCDIGDFAASNSEATTHKISTEKADGSSVNGVGTKHASSGASDSDAQEGGNGVLVVDPPVVSGLKRLKTNDLLARARGLLKNLPWSLNAASRGATGCRQDRGADGPAPPPPCRQANSQPPTGGAAGRPDGSAVQAPGVNGTAAPSAQSETSPPSRTSLQSPMSPKSHASPESRMSPESQTSSKSWMLSPSRMSTLSEMSLKPEASPPAMVSLLRRPSQTSPSSRMSPPCHPLNLSTRGLKKSALVKPVRFVPPAAAPTECGGLANGGATSPSLGNGTLTSDPDAASLRTNGDLFTALEHRTLDRDGSDRSAVVTNGDGRANCVPERVAECRKEDRGSGQVDDDDWQSVKMSVQPAMANRRREVAKMFSRVSLLRKKMPPLAEVKPNNTLLSAADTPQEPGDKPAVNHMPDDARRRQPDGCTQDKDRLRKGARADIPNEDVADKTDERPACKATEKKARRVETRQSPEPACETAAHDVATGRRAESPAASTTAGPSCVPAVAPPAGVASDCVPRETRDVMTGTERRRRSLRRPTRQTDGGSAAAMEVATPARREHDAVPSPMPVATPAPSRASTAAPQETPSPPSLHLVSPPPCGSTVRPSPNTPSPPSLRMTSPDLLPRADGRPLASPTAAIGRTASGHTDRPASDSPDRPAPGCPDRRVPVDPAAFEPQSLLGKLTCRQPLITEPFFACLAFATPGRARVQRDISTTRYYQTNVLKLHPTDGPTTVRGPAKRIDTAEAYWRYKRECHLPTRLATTMPRLPTRGDYATRRVRTVASVKRALATAVVVTPPEEPDPPWESGVAGGGSVCKRARTVASVRRAHTGEKSGRTRPRKTVSCMQDALAWGSFGFARKLLSQYQDERAAAAAAPVVRPSPAKRGSPRAPRLSAEEIRWRAAADVAERPHGLGPGGTTAVKTASSVTTVVKTASPPATVVKTASPPATVVKTGSLPTAAVKTALLPTAAVKTALLPANAVKNVSLSAPKADMIRVVIQEKVISVVCPMPVKQHAAGSAEGGYSTAQPVSALLTARVIDRAAAERATAALLTDRPLITAVKTEPVDVEEAPACDVGPRLSPSTDDEPGEWRCVRRVLRRNNTLFVSRKRPCVSESSRYASESTEYALQNTEYASQNTPYASQNTPFASPRTPPAPQENTPTNTPLASQENTPPASRDVTAGRDGDVIVIGDKTTSGDRASQRSMLRELYNTDGFIGDKFKTVTTDLFADTAALTREERALQRAMVQFTKMEMKVSCDDYTTSVASSNDSDVKTDIKREHPAPSHVARGVVTSPPHGDGARRHLAAAKRVSCAASGDAQPSQRYLSWHTRYWKKRQGRSKKRRTIEAAIRGDSTRHQGQHQTAEPAPSQPVGQSGADDVDSRIAMPADVRKLNVCRDTGETVLHRAARLGYHDVALWCCQTRYVDADARDNAGYTPLHEACANGHVHIARTLLQHGADVNTASRLDGVRPLHDAIESDHVEVVRLLLSCGADTSLATHSGCGLHTLARSQEMKGFIQGYFSDLNGVRHQPTTERLQWEFDQYPTKKDVSEEREADSGFRVFDSCPHSDDGFEPDFEFSRRPHLPVYHLRTKKSRRRCNYVLLDDVTDQLSTTRSDLLSRLARRTPPPRIASADFLAQTAGSVVAAASSSSSSSSSSSPPPRPPRAAAPSLELLPLGGRLRLLLGIEVETLAAGGAEEGAAEGGGESASTAPPYLADDPVPVSIVPTAASTPVSPAPVPAYAPAPAAAKSRRRRATPSALRLVPAESSTESPGGGRVDYSCSGGSAAHYGGTSGTFLAERPPTPPEWADETPAGDDMFANGVVRQDSDCLLRIENVCSLAEIDTIAVL